MPSAAPILETERLRLRPFDPGDLDAVHALWTDPQVRHYLWDDRIISRGRALQEFESSAASFDAFGFGLWCVLQAEGAALLGFCGLRHFGETPEVELLYALAPGHWRNGFATEAARAVLTHGFTHCQLARILARADTPNSASRALMERIGMTFVDEALVDDLPTVTYALSSAEWRSTVEPSRGTTFGRPRPR